MIKINEVIHTEITYQVPNVPVIIKVMKTGDDSVTSIHLDRDRNYKLNTTVPERFRPMIARPNFKELISKSSIFMSDNNGDYTLYKASYNDEELDKEVHNRLEQDKTIYSCEIYWLDRDNDIIYDSDMKPIPTVIDIGDIPLFHHSNIKNISAFEEYMSNHPWVLNKEKLGFVYSPLENSEYYCNKETGMVEILMDNESYHKFILEYGDNIYWNTLSLLLERDYLNVKQFLYNHL
jgi:hypothetical protein